MQDKLNIIIEIPKHSNIKYEYDRQTHEISVDRILYGANIYPHNYGFVKEALDWDGDELDALVISDQAFLPGIKVPVRILGAMEMIDNGEADTKLITVIDCDKRYEHMTKLSDVPEHLLKEIRNFFEQYKQLQNKKVEVLGFRDINWALKEYEECKKMMKEFGHLPKDEFVRIMKIEHPEKYSK